MAGCLVSFGLSLSVLLYFVHARREGYVEAAFLCRLAKVFTACHWSKYQISCAGIYLSFPRLNNSTKMTMMSTLSFLSSADPLGKEIGSRWDQQNASPDPWIQTARHSYSVP